MAHAHTSVNAASRHYLASERRYNYTTPKSFLEQISLYTRLLKTKASELRGRVARLENGLEKLRSTAVQVDKLKEKLAMQELELQQKNEAADTLIAIVGVETDKVQKEKAIGKKKKKRKSLFHRISLTRPLFRSADEEESKVAIIAEEVSKKQKDCEMDLMKAEPALLAAQEALNTLNKANLTELKSFGSPPGAVTNVTAAVMVLLAPAGKIPKDRSWKSAKVLETRSPPSLSPSLLSSISSRPDHDGQGRHVPRLPDQLRQGEYPSGSDQGDPALSKGLGIRAGVREIEIGRGCRPLRVGDQHHQVLRGVLRRGAEEEGVGAGERGIGRRAGEAGRDQTESCGT